MSWLMKYSVLVAFSTTALLVAIVTLLNIYEFVGGYEPSWTSLLSGYVVSFVWLAVPLVEYSSMYPPEHRIDEDELVRESRGVSLGFHVALVLSLLGLFASLFLERGLGFKSLAGLCSVWLGTLTLPYLAIGPEYTLLQAKANKPFLMVPHPFAPQAQAFFATSLILPGLRRNVVKFAFGTWLSAALLAYGWYLVFGSLLGLVGLAMILFLLIISRALAMSSMTEEKLSIVRCYVEQTAKSLPYSNRSIALGIVVFSAWLIYLGILLS